MKNILNSDEFIFGSYGKYGDAGLMVDIRQVGLVPGTGKGFNATYKLIGIPEPESPYDIHVSADENFSVTIAFGGVLFVRYCDVYSQTNVRFSIEIWDDHYEYREQGKEIKSSLWWAKYGEQYVTYVCQYKNAISALFGDDFYQLIVHPQ